MNAMGSKVGIKARLSTPELDLISRSLGEATVVTRLRNLIHFEYTWGSIRSLFRAMLLSGFQIQLFSITSLQSQQYCNPWDARQA